MAPFTLEYCHDMMVAVETFVEWPEAHSPVPPAFRKEATECTLASSGACGPLIWATARSIMDLTSHIAIQEVT
jgi:hypothetical protein